MNNNSGMLDLDSVPEDSSVHLLTNSDLQPALTPEIVKFYVHRASEMKSQIDVMAAEVSQRQDKMRLINEIVSSINNLTDEKQGADLSSNLELQEKLKIAKQLGVELPEGKLKFNSFERDRLIENLHLAGDNWDKENKSQTQKIEIHTKELDRIMMLLKEVQKKEDQAKRPMIAGIKG